MWLAPSGQPENSDCQNRQRPSVLRRTRSHTDLFIPLTPSPYPHTAATPPMGKRKMRRHVTGLPIRCLEEEDYDKSKKEEKKKK